MRERWRSISRPKDGLESLTKCVLYSTAMTPPRPRNDFWSVIFSNSSRWRVAETSSWATWYGGDFFETMLSTYYVSPAGRYLGISLLSCGLAQGLCSVLSPHAGKHLNRAGRKRSPNGGGYYRVASRRGSRQRIRDQLPGLYKGPPSKAQVWP